MTVAKGTKKESPNLLEKKNRKGPLRDSNPGRTFFIILVNRFASIFITVIGAAITIIKEKATTNFMMMKELMSLETAVVKTYQ